MKRHFLIVILSFLTFFSLGTQAATPLPADQVFTLKLQALPNQQISAQWQIAPGYYLYRDRFKFELMDQTQNVQYKLPAGETHFNKFIGNYQAFEKSMNVILQLPKNAATNAVKLKVRYQGCAKSGFCYPPQTRSFLIQNQQITALDNKALSIAPSNTDSSQSTIGKLFATQNVFLVLLTFLGFGVLLAFTPCVLPMIPILSGIIIGQRNLTTHKAFILSLSYVFGVATTYAIAGLIASMLGSHLQASLQSPFALSLFSLIFVLMAFSLFGFYEIQLPHRLQQMLHQVNNKQNSGSYFSTMLMGALSVLVVSPCVTPPLVGALAYISQTGNVWLGTGALWALGVGMGIPLLFVGTLGGKILPKAGPWMETIKKLFGVLMLGVAIWLIQRIISQEVALLLWGLLCIIAAVQLDAFKTTSGHFGARFSKGAGILMFSFGILLSGQVMITSFWLSKTCIAASKENAVYVHSLTELQSTLEQAQQQKRPVLIDFYAEWCVACKELQHNVFNNPELRAQLEKFIIIKVDVTDNSSESQALQNHFTVIAPPAVLFFNKNGEAMPQFRVDGVTDPATFSKNLNQILVNS